ncbi:MAG TPA: hypothetical protein VKI00_24695 [Mycobacterium sp.]|uniref:hypothetical protein n=1 Tax=Mycobacterium sp. TaxID=1785 RepID=UPI002BB372BC|nr:hypothetical protein [Mycobacterium sp.]HME78733.1 hypothetical protein [Mycobacterium sp.]
MSGYVWDLSGSDNRCSSYGPGHQIRWIHFNHSMREPSVIIPVTASVDNDGLVHIEGDDLSLVRWNHRPALVRAALQRFGGRADWKPRWYLLAVPTESFMGSARSVFSLVALDEQRDCHVTRTTNPDHLIPRKPSPTNVPPLRIAARYSSGRRRAKGESARLIVDRNFVLRWAHMGLGCRLAALLLV